MLKTILIAVAQLAVAYSGPIILSYGFGWTEQMNVAMALYALAGVSFLGGLLGLPSVTRFIIGMVTPLLSLVLLALGDIALMKWWGIDHTCFREHPDMFLVFLATIWILVPCGIWYRWGEPKKELSSAS